MSSDVFVRRAQLSDLETIVELRLSLLREYAENPLYGRLRPDAEARAHDLYRAQLTSPLEAIFVAEAEAGVVGILRCVDTPSSPLLDPERYCYVSSAYVRPEWRRRGVLRALLERAIAWCDERGIDEMRLHNAASSIAATEAWQALGFDVVEQVRRRKVRDAPRRRATPLVHVETR